MNHKRHFEIIHDGKTYISRAAYMEAVSIRGGHEMTKLLKEGLPHIVKLRGKQPRQYFNLEDCGAWHRGELDHEENINARELI